MTWNRFWTLGEAGFDRFNTVALTLIVLLVGGYVQVRLVLIIALLIVALIGGTATAIFAALCEPERDSDKWRSVRGLSELSDD